jgi:RNase H-like domain found in reverse transcriptase
MIDAIQTHTSLNLPDPSKPFFVQTDASDVAGAGRVFQRDDQGNELLMACVSRTFTRAERKYGTFRKEVLSLLYCLKSMDFFLRFASKLIILIDAKSIVFLRLCKESQGILLRFSLELSKYDAEIHHVPGVENEVSDVLSRHHKDIDGIIKETKDRNILSEKQSKQILARLTIPSGKKFSPEEVQNLLELESLPAPISRKKKPESKANIGKCNIKNNPATLGEKKVKLPPTLFRRPGLILPKQCLKNCPETSFGINCIHSTTMSYQDLANTTKFLTPGTISIDAIRKAQKANSFTINLLKHKSKKFVKIDDVLFHSSPNRNEHRLVLPNNL